MEQVIEFLKRLPLLSGAGLSIGTEIGQRLIFRYGELPSFPFPTLKCGGVAYEDPALSIRIRTKPQMRVMLSSLTVSYFSSAQIAVCPAAG